LISWKDSFEKINNELDLARKKQNALEELHANGRISQFTYENLHRALTAEIEQIEARRKALAEKMTSKLNELEKQISTLETFLANVEMSYAAGEITEELHSQEVSALNLGLEATKNELNFIKEAIMQLVPEETQAELSTTTETAEPVEAAAPPTETAMETSSEMSPSEPETSVETPVEAETTSVEEPVEMTVEEPETPDVLETPSETLEGEVQETTEETMTEQTVSETPVEETISEEPTLTETPPEETTLEENIVTETPTEETISEEQVLSETPTEDIASETSTEESQPFPEETQEEEL